jgi:transmembrane sensor
MIQVRHTEDGRDAVAADWVVRLQGAELTEADALAFDAWLSASNDNARAYDAALSTMLEVEAAAPAIARGLRGRPANGRRAWLAAGALAAAAAVALMVSPLIGVQPAPQTYVTAKGEHRTVKLADGSVVDLNAASRLTVAFGRHERRLQMAEGEAVFDVAHEPGRPFLIEAGDRTVRVVGTRFDVRRRAGQLSVTVERGVVEVRPADGVAGRGFRLHPGQRLDHAQGAAQVSIRAADPAEVFSWRTGRLIYRDQPLSAVVADLNEQFARPIRIADPSLGDARVSGVLVLDDQAAIVRRLALLAPLSALPSGGEIVLRRSGGAKP